MVINKHQPQEDFQPMSLLLIILTLRVILFTIELITSWKFYSFSLLAVASHLLVDILSIIIAIIATKLAQSWQNQKQQIEAWGGFSNGLLLLVIGLWIGNHVLNSEDTLTEEVSFSFSLLGIAFLELIIKAVSIILLYDPSHNNLNLRGVFLHAIADTANSLSLIITSLAILIFHWLWIDKISAMGIAFLMIISAVFLLTQSFYQRQ
ncbi:cation transporter [Geminocystis sp. NIES-3709]|uniref:cation transporter n=1 Tax=Geminocystis sp. NIES-3709 TaxID=1617448 RepID=UPI0005FC5425|nr:cation transporter [Geminocystis sp. NIES-3709]BAQ66357.1 cobalt-zinc-cadmium resistance protein CzcD [Geminocystis sp. NIES-3709]